MNGFICIDASLAAKWVLPEDGSDLALRFYQQRISSGVIFVAPAFMPVEVVNAIRRRVARGFIGQEDAEAMLSEFMSFSVSLSDMVELHGEALKLAARFERTAIYDMYYVALAQITECELWTADRNLVNVLRGRLPFVRSLFE